VRYWNKFIGGPRTEKKFTKWSVSLKRLRTVAIQGINRLVLARIWRDGIFSRPVIVSMHVPRIDLNELVHLELQESYCLPVLTYASAAVKPTARQEDELNACWNIWL